LAWGASEDLAPWVGHSEIGAAILLVAFGTAVLDVATAALKNKKLINTLIYKVTGVSDADK
jgi:hypothetical protein